MKRQTAVEWFSEQLKEYDYEDFDSDYFEFKIPIWVFAEKVKEAKEMEKEQLNKCYNHGSFSLIDNGHGDTFEQYYNETYNK